MLSPSGWYGMQGLPFVGAFYTALLDVLGYNQKVEQQKSYDAQIRYDEYLKSANKRALEDWHRNIPGREIRYPELSYAGQIYRADTSITRANLGYDLAQSNYNGSLPYRTAGLYGIGGKLSRSL